MQQLLSSLEDERQRQFRRFVAVSAAAHAVLALLFWLGPISHGRPLPAVVRVDLVEVAATAPAARPAPARPKPAPPAPAPPPKPIPPVAEKVLPKEPTPLPKPKPVEAKPKPEPKTPPKPEPKPAEENYEDVLAELRKEKGETTPHPVEQEKAPPGGGPAGPGIVDPELARWQREVKIRVTHAWIVPPGFRAAALVAQVSVELSPAGDVLGTRIKESSGNPWFDESVQRAIQKASPLPAPPGGDTDWVIPFDSREMQ